MDKLIFLASFLAGTLILTLIILRIYVNRVKECHNHLDDAADKLKKMSDELIKTRAENKKLQTDSNFYQSEYIRTKEKYEQFVEFCHRPKKGWEIIYDDNRALRAFNLPAGTIGAYLVIRGDIFSEFVTIANIFPFSAESNEYACNCAEELVEKLNEKIWD